MIYSVTLGVMGAVGLSGAPVQSSSALRASSQSVVHHSASEPMSTVLPSEAPQQGGDTGQGSSGSDYESMVEQIGKMAEESHQPPQQRSENSEQEQGTNVDDISPEERKRQEEIPRNPKKRMYEVEVEMEKRRQAEATKDEL